MAGNNLRGSFSGGSYTSFGGTSSKPLDSFFISPSSSSPSPSPSFLGSSSMVSFEDVCGGKRSERSFFCTYDADENGDDEYDDYFHQPEKKRRLTTEQVHFLEKSFETENKLDPERKVQLAKELGLQPRQVAIWFQNRRARWKNKQLEKDFDTLQSSFNNLKADFDTLIQEKEKLQAEVVVLTDKLHEKEKSKVHSMEPASNTHNQPWKKHQVEPNVESTSESADDSPPKQHEDLNSAKSDDVLDSDNSRRTEPYDSSFAFEADHSDISQDDQDYLSHSLMPFSHVFTKIGGVNCVDPQAQSSNYGLSGDENGASLFWPYWDINLKM